jgi:carboxypeptidase C (cathepsin A)
MGPLKPPPPPRLRARLRLHPNEPALAPNSIVKKIPLKNSSGTNCFNSNPSNPKPQNLAFWWLYRSPDPKAPILCTLPGGPGQTVLTKVFGRYNPLDIDKKTRKLIKNPNSITEKYNLLYIESPVGNGFSVDFPETKVRDFSTLGKNFCEVVKGILG